MATAQNAFTRLQNHSPALRAQPATIVTINHQVRPVPNRRPSTRGYLLFTLPNEPEDVHLTGGTRSLDRRLLALNVAGARTARTRATD
jgi:hypothetical protein